MGTPRFRLVQGPGLGERTASPAVNTSQNNPAPSLQENGTPQSSNINQPSSISPPVAAMPNNISPLPDAGLPPQSRQQPPLQHLPPPNLQMPMQQQPLAPGQVIGRQGQGVQQQPHQQQVHGPPQQIQQDPMLSQQQLQQQRLALEEKERSSVQKCVRFLKTLLNLSTNPADGGSDNPDKATQVRSLIVSIVYSELGADEFTERLQNALNSQAQPHLLPFLKTTLPALRTAVRNGEVAIEGLQPPPGYVFNGRPPPQQQDNMNPPHQNVPTPSGTPNVPSQIISRLNSGPQIQMTPPSQFQRPPQTQPPPMRQSMPPPPMRVLQPIQPPQQHPNQQQQQPLQHQPQPQPQQQPQQQMVEPKSEEENRTRQFTENVLSSSILKPDELMNRITKTIQSSCYVEEEALTAISDAVESRMRELLAQIAGIAEHRCESMRVGENYQVVDDTKRQLRFLEDLDRQEEELRESREKETLIRMSKNKNIGKETIEKAKEMQRVDAEAKRNRDANAAAIAALSTNKTIKNKWEGAGASSAPRARNVRVTTRDLHILINSDNRFHNTFLREKFSYGGPATDTTI